MTFRSDKILQAAEGEPCVLCGKTGTTIAAHANSVALGKGKGIKVPDYYIAFVCDTHHKQIDGVLPLDLAYPTRFDCWLWAFAKTIRVLFDRGIIGVK